MVAGMPLDLAQFGSAGRFLLGRGWTLVPFPQARGTASCDGPGRRILIKPAQFSRPAARTRRYVMPHEIAHALHWELDFYNVDDLMKVRGLRKWSAVEVVAEAWCLRLDKSRWMRATVQASCVWHGRVGYRYRFADCTSWVAMQKVDALRALTEEVDYDARLAVYDESGRA